MKVLLGNSLYVQKKDILFLKNVNVSIPANIIDENINFKNGNEFIKIDDEVGIEFFKNIDFIIDYVMYKDITLEEYRAIDDEITKKILDMEYRFNNMSEREAMEHLYFVEENEKLEYKMNALMELVYLRSGYVDILLPSDIDYVEKYNRSKKRKVRKFKK